MLKNRGVFIELYNQVSGGVRTLKEKLEEIEDDDNHVSVNRLGVSDCAQYFVLMFTHHV